MEHVGLSAAAAGGPSRAKLPAPCLTSKSLESPGTGVTGSTAYEVHLWHGTCCGSPDTVAARSKGFLMLILHFALGGR